jgi:hypothetical protein
MQEQRLPHRKKDLPPLVLNCGYTAHIGHRNQERKRIVKEKVSGKRKPPSQREVST